MNNISEYFPKAGYKLLSLLHEHGYEGYFIGGCVRDAILKRKAFDFDIATDALPSEVKSIFPHTIDTGIKHGTVTVILDGESFEVTTYRIDGKYLDSRHPQSVTFSRSLKEDVKRRDLTINALAYSLESGIIDYTGGLEDIKNKTIRLIGNKNKRLEEDALRIMRVYRFAAELNFQIEEETLEATSLSAELLNNISIERIRDEFNKIITSQNVMIIKKMYEKNILATFLPEFAETITCKQNNPYHKYTVGIHSLVAMNNIDNDLILRLVMLLHDIGKIKTKTTINNIDHFYNHQKYSYSMSLDILKRMKYPNKIIEEVSFLVLHHCDMFSLSKKSIRKAMYKITPELFPLFLKVREADLLAQSNLSQKEKIPKLQEAISIYQEILKENNCFSLKDLKVNGNDLIALGYRGKEIGVILNNMLKAVIEDERKNDKDYLLTNIFSFED